MGENYDFTELTAEQEEQIPAYVQAGLEIVRSTASTDDAILTQSFQQLYAASEMGEVDVMIVNSPLQAYVIDHLWGQDQDYLPIVEHDDNQYNWRMKFHMAPDLLDDLYRKIRFPLQMEAATPLYEALLSNSQSLTPAWEMFYCGEGSDPVPLAETNAVINTMLDESGLDWGQRKGPPLRKEDTFKDIYKRAWLRGQTDARAIVMTQFARDVIGVPMMDHFNAILNICRQASLCFCYPHRVIASRKPVIQRWENNQLHCPDGPTMMFADGYARWLIEGLSVPSRFVTDPGSLSVEEINAEENDELRRVMIGQYTWDRYLLESGAQVLDTVYDSDGIMQSLMAAGGMKVFCCACNSTARTYTKEVGEDCMTVADAQAYMMAIEDALAGVASEEEMKKISTDFVVQT